jgi:hypothetical protein
MIKKILIVLLSLNFISCNLDINTVDPQASKSITASKKEKLFIEEFLVDTTKSTCFVNQAWVEYNWRNQLHFGKVFKNRIGGLQLVLNFDPKDLPFGSNDYLWKWRLIDSTYGTFGMENGRYALNLDEKESPLGFKISLIQLPSKKEVCTIFLKKNIQIRTK